VQIFICISLQFFYRAPTGSFSPLHFNPLPLLAHSRLCILTPTVSVLPVRAEQVNVKA